MIKHKIQYAEFYITNVCNLACPGCNRFNNYQFRGYQKWKDHAEIYSRWAQEVDIGSIGLLGGEPLLTPDAMEWIHGIDNLWPNKSFKIVTNGFYLNKVRGLYDFLRTHPNVKIWVGIHNKCHKPEIMEEIEKFLVGPLTHEFNNDHKYQQFLMITDANGVKIKVEFNWWFHQGSIKTDNGVRTLHQSDPKKAHNICHMKTCHHFIRGKLYKCGVVALLPEFDKQHPLSLSAEDRDLMESYRPLTLDDSYDKKSQFIRDLPNQIDQCRFCPEEYYGDMIYAAKKKDIKWN